MFLSRLQDFYNLVDVYLDAVLHPRCVTDPKTFEQEGWHHELDKPEVRVGDANNDVRGPHNKGSEPRKRIA